MLHTHTRNPRSSRNSTTETAQAIAKEAQLRRGGAGGAAGGPFVRGGAQQQRLQAAAAATKNKTLQVGHQGCSAAADCHCRLCRSLISNVATYPQALLPLGIGYHNAAMESEDRALVEQLFREAAVMVLVSHRTPRLSAAPTVQHAVGCVQQNHIASSDCASRMNS